LQRSCLAAAALIGAAAALAFSGGGENDSPSAGTTDVSGNAALPGSASSLDDLARRVLAALSTRDTATLGALRLSEGEHNQMVWPELPASAPEVNYPVDFAWTNIGIRNRAALATLLYDFRDAEPELTGTECRGPTQSFESFVVHTNCWVEFRTDGGGPRAQQLYKDVLDWDGELKVFRYYEP